MTAKTCMLIHGFTGSPKEVAPLAGHLSEKGWSCVLPTLPGHGGDLRMLRHSHRREWIEGAAREAEKLSQDGGEFDIVGFSMGGLLASYIANRYPVRRLVLLNTAVYYLSPYRLVRDVARRLKEGELNYFFRKQSTPIEATFQFMRLVRELKPEIGRIRVPTLVIQGELDQIVHPLSGRYIMNHLKGAKQYKTFARSRHMIFEDEEAQLVFEEVERFLEDGIVT